MSAAISQLSCFASISRNLQLKRRSEAGVTLRSKLSVVMSLEGYNSVMSNSGNKANLSYAGDPTSSRDEAANSNTTDKHLDGNISVKVPVKPSVDEPKRAAKIHDFCFGIPFGGIVLTGGLLGFVFSRNLTALTTGVLFGGALLALSTISLKIWRQGKSSLPFILGQAALSAALFWKNFQNYSLTGKLFPSGISAAMRFTESLMRWEDLNDTHSSQRRNAVLLFICGDLRRKSAAEEDEANG